MSTENQGSKPTQQDDTARQQSDQANTANPASKKPVNKRTAKAKTTAKAPAAPKAKKTEAASFDGQSGYAGTGR